MPERPPKAWFRRAVRSISRRFEVDDPQALAGWVWRYGMSEARRREVLREEDPERQFDPRDIDVIEEEPIYVDTPERGPPRFFKKKRRIADPQELPPPIDLAGFDNVNMVRVVPRVNPSETHEGVDRLLEVQVKMPKQQFERLWRITEPWTEIEGHAKDERDVEHVEDIEGSGKRRIVRRGRANIATNIFIDEA